MRVEKSTHSRLPFFVLLALVMGLGAYAYTVARETDALWEAISAATGEASATASVVKIGDTSLAVPSWEIFRSQQLWLYVSKQKSLTASYTPDELVAVGVPHGDADQTMQVDQDMQPALAALFAAAKEDGVALMLSSAYRSEADQRQIYDTYLARQGQAYVNQYVAQPLQSEHQTGLAVDITAASLQCEADSYNCNITRPVVEWLEASAATFGFIQRYPAGKQSITGTASEEWHYRYVGKALATALMTEELTFDEFVQQTAPGYAQ